MQPVVLPIWYRAATHRTIAPIHAFAQLFASTPGHTPCMPKPLAPQHESMDASPRLRCDTERADYAASLSRPENPSRTIGAPTHTPLNPSNASPVFMARSLSPWLCDRNALNSDEYPSHQDQASAQRRLAVIRLHSTTQRKRPINKTPNPNPARTSNATVMHDQRQQADRQQDGPRCRAFPCIFCVDTPHSMG